MQVRMDRLVVAAAVTAIVAAAGTGALFAAASATGLVDTHVRLPTLIGTGTLTLGAVWVATVVAVAGAAVLLAILRATTRHAVRNFRAAATVLAIVSLSMPATIAGPPAAMRLVLVGMHVVVWAACVCVLATLVGRSPARSAAATA